jgi:outer membrane lipoprotein SlyB
MMADTALQQAPDQQPVPFGKQWYAIPVVFGSGAVVGGGIGALVGGKKHRLLGGIIGALLGGAGSTYFTVVSSYQK